MKECEVCGGSGESREMHFGEGTCHACNGAGQVQTYCSECGEVTPQGEEVCERCWEVRFRESEDDDSYYWHWKRYGDDALAILNEVGWAFSNPSRAEEALG